MTPWRSGLLRLTLAGGLLAGGWAYVRPHPAVAVDAARAAATARRLLAVYEQTAGEPPAHFVAAGTMAYADGWEFRFTYRPCPDQGELRIFVTPSGVGRFSKTPDCGSRRGVQQRPEFA